MARLSCGLRWANAWAEMTFPQSRAMAFGLWGTPHPNGPLRVYGEGRARIVEKRYARQEISDG
jgi:hypothetical protein